MPGRAPLATELHHLPVTGPRRMMGFLRQPVKHQPARSIRLHGATPRTDRAVPCRRCPCACRTDLNSTGRQAKAPPTGPTGSSCRGTAERRAPRPTATSSSSRPGSGRRCGTWRLPSRVLVGGHEAGRLPAPITPTPSVTTTRTCGYDRAPSARLRASTGRPDRTALHRTISAAAARLVDMEADAYTGLDSFASEACPRSLVDGG
jgi:hypothetical protein